MKPINFKDPSTWLAAGALVGALMAATGLVEDTLSPLQDSVIATIDGEAIYLLQYQDYVERMQKDRGKPLTARDREHVLDRMIDEKLLIRQGEQSGLPRTDPAVRKALVDAVIENIVSAEKGALPPEAQLQRFYADNRAYFSHTPRLQLRRMRFSGADAALRADRAAAALLRGEPFNRVRSREASEEILSLPSTPIPANRLANYLGPSLAGAAAELEPGQFSTPMASGDAIAILQLLDKSPGATPALADIAEQVLREFQRRANDRALQQYLAQLRADSDVRVNKAALRESGDSSRP